MPETSETGLIRASKANGDDPMGRGRPPRQQYVDNRERDQDIVTDYVVHRLTLAVIAAKHGISIPRVSQIIKTEREAGRVDFNLLRHNSANVLAEIQRRQLEISNLLPAPVTVGKDGLILVDPETGEVVRDHAVALKALADAVRTDDALARRFGLDAATKVETQATVRYEVVGVDVEKLT